MAELENERRFSAVPTQESIAAASDFLDVCVEEFDIPMRTGYSLKVVTDEIFSNIVYYSKASLAQILFRNEPERVTLVFMDNGAAYNPLEAEDPDTTLGVEERDIGGLGLLMVKKMAEEVTYAYTDGNNQLTVVMSKTPKKKKMSLEDFDL